MFPRVKVGVGSPADHDMIDWVIGVPPKEDRKVLLDSLNRALDAAACIIESGTDRAMNQFN